MAKSHKKAGRSIAVTSTLPADKLAALCKDAAEQGKLQIDAVEPGRMVFSVRSPVSSRIHFMTFEVRLSGDAGRQVMTSRITHYKTRQKKLFMLIPVEPKRMLALASYEKFMQRFEELVRSTDPQASIAMTG